MTLDNIFMHGNKLEVNFFFKGLKSMLSKILVVKKGLP
jgi:hypothetical protein